MRENPHILNWLSYCLEDIQKRYTERLITTKKLPNPYLPAYSLLYMVSISSDNLCFYFLLMIIVKPVFFRGGNSR